MRKQTRRAGIAAVAVGVCLSWAVAVMAVEDWTEFVTVGQISNQPATGAGAMSVFVAVPTGSYNPSIPACTTRDAFYFTVDTPERQRMFAMILAAKVTNRRVRLWVKDVCHAWGQAQTDGVIIE